MRKLGVIGKVLRRKREVLKGGGREGECLEVEGLDGEGM